MAGVGNALDVAAEDDETCDTDAVRCVRGERYLGMGYGLQDEGEDLQGANEVDEPKRVLVMRDDKDDSKGISCNSNTSHLPFGGGIAGHSPKVLGKNYTWSELET